MEEDQEKKEKKKDTVKNEKIRKLHGVSAEQQSITVCKAHQ